MADLPARALAGLAARGFDVRDLADALLLAAARAPYEDRPPDGERPADDRSGPPGTAEGGPDATSDAAPATGRTRHISGFDPQGGTVTPGTLLSLGRATALPESLALGRALRPLRRRWPHGVRQRLDVDATVEFYARTGLVLPQLRPAAEHWLDVIVLVDRAATVAVWDESVRALTRVLLTLDAFRSVRTWHLDWDGATPTVRDHHRRAVVPERVARREGQSGRRLLLVVSDCAAPGWYQDAPWLLLRSWGRVLPLALLNPLPRRLWRRSALDLPAARATAPAPAAPGDVLRYRAMRRLPATPATDPWQALPVLALHPPTVAAWAGTLMRGDPGGCDAVLIPATGRPPGGRRAPEPPTAVGDGDVAARADAFVRTAPAPAAKLAVVAASLDSFTLPLLHVLREQAVPDARLDDLAELLTAGLLTTRHRPGHDDDFTFHPAARDRLRQDLHREDAWRAQLALTRHVAAHPWAPHGITAVLHTPGAGTPLPTTPHPLAETAAPPPPAGPAPARAVPDARAGSAAPAADGGAPLHDARIVAVVRAPAAFRPAGRFTLAGSGYAIGPGAILTAVDILSGRDAIGVVGAGAASVVACRIAWLDLSRGVALLLTDGEVVDPALTDDGRPVPWGELGGHQLPGTFHVRGVRWVDWSASPPPLTRVQLTGDRMVRSRRRDSYRLRLTGARASRAQSLPGAPVFLGDTFLGIVVPAGRDGERGHLAVAPSGGLFRDRAFAAHVDDHLPPAVQRLFPPGQAPAPAGTPPDLTPAPEAVPQDDDARRRPRVYISARRGGTGHHPAVPALQEFLERQGFDVVTDLALPGGAAQAPWMRHLGDVDHILVLGSPDPRRPPDTGTVPGSADGLPFDLVFLLTRRAAMGDPVVWMPNMVGVLLPGDSPDDLPPFARRIPRVVVDSFTPVGAADLLASLADPFGTHAPLPAPETGDASHARPRLGDYVRILLDQMRARGLDLPGTRDLRVRFARGDGEDRDWLVALTLSATREIDAISTPAERGFWESELGLRYLRAQREAVAGGVSVRRLFIVDTPGQITPELAQVLDEHQQLGIEVRAIAMSELDRGLGREEPVACVVFDGALSYETTSEPDESDDGTALVLQADKVAERIRRFRELWEAGQ